MEEKRSNLMFLDGLRGIAALYVMAGHARWLLWEGYNSYQAHKANYNIADKFFVYFLEMFKFGHEFVLFFFVLSGFVIHLRYAKNLHLSGNAKFNWGEYVYKRAKRIYPPFIFAILLTMFLDFIGTRINPIIYEGHTANLLVNKTIGNPNHEVLTFFGNLAFLYQEYVPIFGTNGPTWSLKYEWWFYMLYPLFLFLGKKHIIYPTIILLILFVASITISHWPEPLSQEIFGGMLAWWFGVLLCEIYVGRINISWAVVVAGFLILFVSTAFVNTVVVHDISTACFFSAILGLIIYLADRGNNLNFLTKLKPVGDMSYTLYITHFPILVLISTIVLKFNHNVQPKTSYLVIFSMIICFAAAYVFSLFTEKPFVKKKVRKLNTVKSVA